MKILEVKNLTKSFGAFKAVSDASFSLNQGEIIGLIGPNGAGKTTLLRLISGELAPSEGKIFFKGEDITKYSFHKTAIRGISRCFQVPFVFDSLSVIDNVKVAGRVKKLKGPALVKWCEEILNEVGMLAKKDVLVRVLSHGEKRILEWCMSIIQQPDLLLVDEIAAGLAESEIALMDKIIKDKVKSTAFLIVEHRLEFLFGISQRVIVMHKGGIIADGSPNEIKDSQTVRKAYYGEE